MSSKRSKCAFRVHAYDELTLVWLPCCFVGHSILSFANKNDSMEVALESLCRSATGKSSKVKIKYASKGLQPNLSWHIDRKHITCLVCYLQAAFQQSFRSDTDQHQSFESIKIRKTIINQFRHVSVSVLKHLSVSFSPPARWGLLDFI